MKMINFRVAVTSYLLLFSSSLIWSQDCTASFSFAVSNCNLVSFTPDVIGQSNSYAWDFGDGNTSNAITPSHTFISYGAGLDTFVVTLKVAGLDCDTSTAVQSVIVTQVPDPSIIDPSGLDFIRCNFEEPFVIRNNSSTVSSNTSYVIDWGDFSLPYESSEFDELEYLYFLPGQYNLVVRVSRDTCSTIDTIPLILSQTPSIGGAYNSAFPVCIPGSAQIQINNTSTNTPNTTYTIEVNDGSDPIVFNHPPPSVVSVPILETSCGTNSNTNGTLHLNAFQISVTARTGCPGQFSSAAIGPIRTNTKPKADFAVSPDQIICQGTELVVTNTSIPGQFVQTGTNACIDRMLVTWSITPSTGYTLIGSLIDSVGFRAVFNTPGSYSIRLIVSNRWNPNIRSPDRFCGSDTITKTICVLPAPIANYAAINPSDLAGCAPLEINFMNTSNTVNEVCGNTEYLWETTTVTSTCAGIGMPDFIQPTASNTTHAFLNFEDPGKYILSLTATNSCGTDTFLDTLMVNSVCSNQPICTGSTLRLQATSNSPNVIYTWQGPNGFSSNADNPTIDHCTPSATGLYFVTLTDTISGCIDTSVIDVLVYERPIFTVSPSPAKLCFGDSITLIAGGNFTFNWSPATELDTTSGPNVIHSPSMLGISTYYVTATDSNNCAAMDSIAVETFPLPVVEAGPDFTHCLDADLQLNGLPEASDGISGVWTGSNVSSIGLFNASSPGAYTLFYTFTDNNGCSSTDSMQVCVRSEPIPSFELPETTCINTPVSVINNSFIEDVCGTSTYQWEVEFLSSSCSSGNGSWSFVTGSNETSENPSFQFSQSGIYNVVLYVDNGCQIYSFRKSIDVGESPRVTLNHVGGPFCNDIEITPVATVEDCQSAITSYQWMFNGGVNMQSSDLLTPGPIDFGSGDHSITLLATNLCGEDVSTVSFTVLDAAMPNITIQDSICAGEILSVVNATTGDSLSFFWTIVPASVASIANPNARNPSFTFNQIEGNHMINVQIFHPVCPTIAIDYPIYVNRTPTVTLAPLDDACETVTFTPLPTYNMNTIHYKNVLWNFPTAFPSSSSQFNPTQITYPNPGNHTFSVTVSNECGEASASQSFRLLDGPEPSFVVADSVCLGEPFTVVNNLTGDDLIYAWSVVPAGSATISDITSGTPTIEFNSPLMSGEYTVNVTVSNALCPAVDASYSVYVNQAPTVSLLPIADDCETLTLTPTVTYNLTENFISDFKWSFPGANPSTSTAANPMNILYANPGEYTVTIMVGNECGESSASQSFRLLDGPEPSFVVADSVCLGEPFTVVNNSTGDDLIYDWSVVPAGSANISDTISDNPTIDFNGPLASGEYTLNVKVSNSLCPSVSASYTVYVNQAPTVSLLPIADDCETLTMTPMVTYNLSENFISSFNWSFPGAVPSTSTAAHPTNVVYSSPGEYMVTIMVGNECGEASASQSFSLLNGPEPSFVVADSVCIGEPVTIVNNSTGDELSYAWTAIPGIIDFSNPNIGNPDLNISEFTPSGLYQLQVVVSNPICGSNTSSFSLYVNRAPLVFLLSIPDDCYCESQPQPLDLQVTYSLDNNFISQVQWSIPGGDSSQLSEFWPQNVFIPEPGSHTVTVSVFNECGFYTDSTSFITYEKPMVNFDVDSIALVSGQSVNLTAGLSANPDFSYLWSTGDTNPDITVDSPGIYVLTVFSSYCSPSTDTVIVYLASNLQHSLPPFTEIKVFPNPAKDIIVLSLTAAQTDIFPIRVFDSLGKSVYQAMLSLVEGQVERHEINSILLSPGVYYLNIGNETLKLIIMP